MILQALVGFYEQLAKEHPEKIARVGWCSRQVAFMLVLSSEGELVNVIPSDEKRGWTMMVPEQVKRTVGVAANLLCDNATYLLGIDAKGKPERARQCFEAARERHLAFLQGVGSPSAAAIRRFFETWNPEDALSRVAVTDAGEALLAGGNLVFRVDGKNALDDPAIRSAWEKACEKPSEGAAVMTCLVSGKQAPIARLHPAIKGVVGAQAMGASLVGFNARAFESYGHDEEQGLNAPVSEYATFAYSTALNYLLSDRKHHMRIGDTTVVYWADKHDQACVDIMSDFLNPQTGRWATIKNNESGKGDPDRVIDAVMQRLAQGLPIGEVDPDANFYVLGLAPTLLACRFVSFSGIRSAPCSTICTSTTRDSISRALRMRRSTSCHTAYWLKPRIRMRSSRLPHRCLAVRSFAPFWGTSATRRLFSSRRSCACEQHR